MPVIFTCFSITLCITVMALNEHHRMITNNKLLIKQQYEKDAANKERDEIAELLEDTKNQLEQSQKLAEELQKQVDELKEENEKIKNAKNMGVSTQASSFKSYMDYRTITDKSSDQYKLRQMATTDSNGLRKIGDYYCVAMGTFYGKVGDTFYVETDEGASWKVILADIKSDKHTDSTNRYTKANGCMMEFLVDTRKIPSSIKNSGTVNGLGFQGNITTVKEI